MAQVRWATQAQAHRRAAKLRDSALARGVGFLLLARAVALARRERHFALEAHLRLGQGFSYLTRGALLWELLGRLQEPIEPLADDKAFLCQQHLGQQLVVIGLAVHHMDQLDQGGSKELAYLLHHAPPAQTLALRILAILVRVCDLRFLRAHQHLVAQHPQRDAKPIRGHRHGTVQTVAVSSIVEPAQALPAALPAVANARRVVQRQHLLELFGSLTRRHSVRLEEYLILNPLVLKEAVQALELRIVLAGHLRKTLLRRLAEHLHHRAEALEQRLVFKLGAREFLTQRRQVLVQRLDLHPQLLFLTEPSQQASIPRRSSSPPPFRRLRSPPTQTAPRSAA